MLAYSPSITPIKKEFQQFVNNHSDGLQSNAQEIIDLALPPISSSTADKLSSCNDPVIKLFARGDLPKDQFSQLTTAQVKIIAIVCIQNNELDALTYLFGNGANPNLDLSGRSCTHPLLLGREINILLEWVKNTPFLTSLNLRNNNICIDLARQIHEVFKAHPSLQSVKLTDHPDWVGNSLSSDAADVVDRFIPELFQRFEWNIRDIGDQMMLQAKMQRESGNTLHSINTNLTSDLSGPQRQKVADYIHLCSHILNLLQNITTAQNLPDLHTTLQNIPTEAGNSEKHSPHLSAVITAHPTRLSHPDFAVHKNNILNLVSKLSDMKTSDANHEVLSGKLTQAINNFCNTPALRTEKPTVVGEHDELLVTPFPTLQSAVKHVGKNLANGGQAIEIRTWAAGDHDGHPGVTHDIVENAAIKRSTLVLNDYEARLEKLSNKIMDLDEVQPGTALKAVALIDMSKKRIEATISAINSQQQSSDAARYENSKQLLDDLKVLGEIMNGDIKLQSLVNKTLSNLITRVEAFGLHYASVDLRQNSAVFEEIIGNLTKEFISDGRSYKELEEPERVKLLTSLIRNPVTLMQLCEKSASQSETVKKELALIGSALRMQKTISSDAIGYQIIANTEQQSDILEALVTVIAAGGYDPETKQLSVPIVPLFETLEDLRQCDQIMAATFATYKDLGITFPNGIQPIMVGYSDSNKDGGILAARVTVFDAVTRLNAVATPFGQKLNIFHGNGGSEARGGGDIAQTIRARSVVGETTDMTVQGEAANHLLASRKLGAANLAELITANQTRLDDPSRSNESTEINNPILSILANISETHYREFHDSETFKNVYFALNKMLSSTPTNPGSRPASRSASNDLASVRAITHNTPTTVARMMFQAIFGVGTAFENYLSEANNGLQELQDLYKTSAQFKSIIDDIETALAKVNPIIVENIFTLLPMEHQEDAQQFLTMWKTEFDLTKKHLLTITQQKEIMENKPEQKAVLEERLAIADASCWLMVDQVTTKASAADVAVSVSTVINMMGAV